MDILNDYQVRFWDAGGGPLEEVCIVAENSLAVSFQAGEIASKIHAFDFSILLLPPKIYG